MKPGRLNDKQQRIFVRRIRDEVISLDELIKQVGVQPERLSRWLTNDRFWRAFRAARRPLRRRLEMELELGRMVAARRLNTLTASRDSQQARLASLNLLSIAGRMSMEIFHRAQKAAKNAGEREMDLNALPSPVHPDVSIADAERMAEELERSG